MATTTKTYSIAGQGTWVAPPGIGTSIKGEAWGGGGGGGAATAGEGGGGGGAYGLGSNFPVTALTQYAYFVGTSGAVNVAGGSSWVGGTTTIFAPGGINASGTASGAGGTTGAGDLKFAGGLGGHGSSFFGGGGGGGGANSGIGGTGGAGVTNGGIGGTAGAGAGGGGHGGGSNVVGTAGTAPGGGGGGAGTTQNAAAGALGQVKLTYTTPLLSALTDNYNAGTLDLLKWADTSFGGTVAFANNQINLLAPVSLGGDGAEINSIENYDLTGNYAAVNVVQVASSNADTSLILYLDGNNNIRLTHDGTYAGLGTNILEASKTVASVYASVANIAYNPATMLWWRIRESAGTVYYDYSADGLSWTGLGSVANPFAVTSLTAILQVYDGSADLTPGTAIYDNFNLLPSATQASIGYLGLLGIGNA